MNRCTNGPLGSGKKPSPDVATSLNNLAFTKPRAATGMPNHCTNGPLRSLEKALGPDHPNVANSLNNLASIIPQARWGCWSLSGPLRSMKKPSAQIIRCRHLTHQPGRIIPGPGPLRGCRTQAVPCDPGKSPRPRSSGCRYLTQQPGCSAFGFA